MLDNGLELYIGNAFSAGGAKGRIGDVSRTEQMLRQIAELEKELEDTLDYRDSIDPRNLMTGAKIGVMSKLRYRFAARQIQRHLQYLRLQISLTQDSLEKARELERRKV